MTAEELEQQLRDDLEKCKRQNEIFRSNDAVYERQLFELNELRAERDKLQSKLDDCRQQLFFKSVLR